MLEPVPRMFDAFLSYASADRRQVRAIQRFLERALRATGVAKPKVYVDSTDVRGGDLPLELRRALERSRALIVCCSPAAKASSWVEREIASFVEARPTGLVLPVLLSGNPSEAISPALGEMLRYHDVRGRIRFGVITPGGRDELLRMVAALTGAELRDLINWDRRRLLKLGAGATAALIPAAGGAAWLYDQATRLRASDVSARIVLRRSDEPDWDEGRMIGSAFSSGATLTVRGTTVPETPKSPWPQRQDGIIKEPVLLLRGVESSKDQQRSLSGDGTVHTSTREYRALQGRLGVLDRRARWEGAMLEARLEVAGVTIEHRQPGPGNRQRSKEEEQTRERWRAERFDKYYGITADMRNSWIDYNAVPIPIAAEIQLFLNNEPIWSSNGLAARLFQGSEERRALHIIYFPPISPEARSRMTGSK